MTIRQADSTTRPTQRKGRSGVQDVQDMPIERIAEILKGMYTRERRSYLTNVGRPQARDDAHDSEPCLADLLNPQRPAKADGRRAEDRVWLDLAEQVQANDIDPAMFIRRQFDATEACDAPPWPNGLSLGRYEKGCEVARRQIASALRLNVNTATTEFALPPYEGDTKQDQWRSVLMQMQQPLSPLFRYCLARSILEQTGDQQFADVMSEYRVVAALQYVRDADEYDRLWGPNLIPAGFREMAASIYEELYGRL